MRRWRGGGVTSYDSESNRILIGFWVAKTGVDQPSHVMSATQTATTVVFYDSIITYPAFQQQHYPS